MSAKSASTASSPFVIPNAPRFASSASRRRLCFSAAASAAACASRRVEASELCRSEDEEGFRCVAVAVAVVEVEEDNPNRVPRGTTVADADDDCESDDVGRRIALVADARGLAAVVRDRTPAVDAVVVDRERFEVGTVRPSVELAGARRVAIEGADCVV